MKRAFTITEVLITVVIISIIAAIGVPAYNNLKKRIEYKEALGVTELVRAAASYYFMKYGSFSSLGSGDAAWVDLKINKPEVNKLNYEIADVTGTKYLRIKNAGNDLLYSYQLPNGPGTKEAHADTAYLPDDLPM